MTEHLWTVDDVASFLAISRRAVYDLAGLPRVLLPGTRTRPILRFDPEQVRRWARGRLTHTLPDVQPDEARAPRRRRAS